MHTNKPFYPQITPGFSRPRIAIIASVLIALPMSGIAQSTSGGSGGGGSSGGNSGSGSSSAGQNSSGSQRTGGNQNSNGQQQRSGTNQNSNSSQQRTGTNQNSNTQQPQQGTNQNPGMSQQQSGTNQNSNAQQPQQGTNQNPNMSQQPTGINPNTTPLQPGVAPSPSVPQQQFGGTQNTNAQQQRNGTTPSQGVPQQPLGSNQPITGQQQQQQPGMNQNTNMQQQRGLPQNPNVNQQGNLGNTASPLTPANQTGALGTSFSGNIGAFTGNGFSLVSSPNGTPTNFMFGTETLFLDSSGRNIPRERFTSETPATVYYTRSGDNMIASRVVANDPPPVFSAGTIREVSPGVLVVELPGASPTPVRYVDNKSTNYVDQNGDPVSPDSIKSGTIAKVFYTKVGDTLVASKVEVVRQEESSGLPKPPLPDASSDSTAKPEGTTKP